MGLMNDVVALVRYAERVGLIDAQDLRWAYNCVLGVVRENGPKPTWSEDDGDFDLEATIARIGAVGIANGVDEDTPSGHDRVETEVMGVLMPRPSDINRRFYELERTSALAATDWFYRLCCNARYVREAAIAHNVSWLAQTAWGELEITINLSKPEKDPAAIAAAGAAPSGEQYPACQLCRENEGYYGRGAGVAFGAHPARQNLRVVPVDLGGEEWGLQYSPYAYFEEHCIALSSDHRRMKVSLENMGRLFDFVDRFPQYFIGSNADLPIVGGSILSHDHFQGGRHEFPMMRAGAARTFALAGFEGLTCEVLRWPLTVLRVVGDDRAELLQAACVVTEAWRAWSDESVGVASRDADGTPHNTVTPVVRMKDGRYELYIALRCNVTNDEHPLGVFHPHEDKWHVKKENIGLIEVMGMAILPPRLLDEIDDGRLTRDEVGRVFGGVLEDAGVFKWDEAGGRALDRFLKSLE